MKTRTASGCVSVTISSSGIVSSMALTMTEISFVFFLKYTGRKKSRFLGSEVLDLK